MLSASLHNDITKINLEISEISQQLEEIFLKVFDWDPLEDWDKSVRFFWTDYLLETNIVDNFPDDCITIEFDTLLNYPIVKSDFSMDLRLKLESKSSSILFWVINKNWEKTLISLNKQSNSNNYSLIRFLEEIIEKVARLISLGNKNI